MICGFRTVSRRRGWATVNDPSQHMMVLWDSRVRVWVLGSVLVLCSEIRLHVETFDDLVGFYENCVHVCTYVNVYSCIHPCLWSRYKHEFVSSSVCVDTYVLVYTCEYVHREFVHVSVSPPIPDPVG